MDQDYSAITQMRRSVENLGSSTEKYEDPTLMRFLIARSMDTEKAAKMFVQWQKWRAEFVPGGSIPDDQVQDELNAGKIYLQGPTRKGNPLVIIKASKHYPAKDQLQFRRFVVHLLDKSIASGFKGRDVGNEKLVAVIDLQSLAYRNVDARGLITGFQFLQAYYPERLAKLYIVHMPGFFVAVWRFVSRFLEKATAEKVVIVKNDDEMKEFISDVGEDVLPEDYGGKAQVILLQDYVLTPLDD